MESQPRRRTPAAGARPAARRTEPRGGSVLLTVLVIVALLAFAVYTFAELSVSEMEATVMYGRASQTRALADSGIDLAKALLADPLERVTEDYYHRPEMFCGILLQDSLAARGRGRCCVIAPNDSDPTSSSVRYGLIDESGKLNLNVAVKWNLSEAEKRNLLIWLPDMTMETADAIFDWIDEDSLSRQYGAESDFYEALPQPYIPVNGPLSSLDELLLVRGVTPELLYGEDANRNGLLDSGEDLNGDGSLQRGWSAYFTIYSRESNLRSDGVPRIFLNQDDLAALYDALEAEYDEEVARFITAYRLNGAAGGTASPGRSGGRGGSGRSRSSSGGDSASDDSLGSGDSSSVNNVQPEMAGANDNVITASPSSGSSGGGSGGSGFGSGRLRRAGGSGRTRTAENGDGPKRGGLDLSGRPQATINSIYDLVDAQVRATVNGQQQTLQSPWLSREPEFLQALPAIVDALTTVDSSAIDGRVNINHAPYEVLVGLPGMNERIANAIVMGKNIGPNGEPVTDILNSHATSAWLIAEGIADLPSMRQLDRYITGRGDVFRLQSVGFFDAGGPATRLEAVLDATESPPKMLSFRDLTELGAGYSRAQLAIP